MPLTTKKVEALRRKPGRYSDGHGLVLQVFSANSASWLLRYQRKGRERWLGLGPLHTFGLMEARDRARRARALLADGIDPLEKKRSEAAKNITFAACAQQYFEVHEGSWSNQKHRRQFLSTLQQYAFPRLGALPVAEIDEALVLAVLRPIWKDKTVTAKRVRRRVAAVLDFAAAAKYRTGSNPARWEGHLEYLLPQPEKIVAVKHHEAVPHSEIAAFMTALRAAPGVAARALEFCILTAARTNEVIGAQWSEVDLDNRVWTIPAERMKAAREHRVPLAPRAVELLSALPGEKDNKFVFIGPRPGTSISNMAMYRTMRRLNQQATVHGFRSTFSTWAHEATAYPAHVIEQSLAHTVGSAVERAYRRSDLFDKRRKLMEAWAKHCLAAPVGEVVALRRQS
jgi:integrase